MVYRGTLSSRCDQKIDDVEDVSTDATAETIVILPQAIPSLLFVTNEGASPMTVSLPGHLNPFGRVEIVETTIAAGAIGVIPFGALSLGGFPTVVLLSTTTDVRWFAVSLGESPLSPSRYVGPAPPPGADIDESFEFVGNWPGTVLPPAPVWGAADLVDSYETGEGWPT